MAKRKRMSPDQNRKEEEKVPIRRTRKREGNPMPDDHQKYLEDLQVKRVELEVQLERLRNEKNQVSALLHKYSLLFDLSPVCYFTLTAEGLIADVNPAAVELLGHDRSSLIKQEFGKFLSPESENLFAGFLQRRFEGKGKEQCDVTLSHYQGYPCSLQLEGRASISEQLCFLIAHDVTEQKIREETLAEQKSLFHTIYRKVPVKTLLLDPDSENILEVNEAAAAFYGYSAEEMKKMNFSDLNLPSRQQQVKLFYGNSVSWEKDQYVFKQKVAGGQIRDVKASFDLVQFDDRSVLLSTIEDVTNKRRLEEVNMERNFWTMESRQNLGAGPFVLDFVHDSWSSSENLDMVLGLNESQDWTINGFISLVHPDQKAGFQYYLFSEVIARKQPFEREFIVIRPCDGKERWISGTADLEFDEAGLLLKMKGSLQDITERKNTEEAIAEAEKMYHLLMNASPDGIVFLSKDGLITEISRLVQDQFGSRMKEEMLGKHYHQFIPRAERKKVAELIELAIADGLPQSCECRLLKLDRTYFISEISLMQIKRMGEDQKTFIAIVRDVTARKKREQQMIHLDRMAHLGEMATGMAHEINQPLNNISMALDNVFHEIKLKDSLHDTYLQHKSNKIFNDIVKIKNLIEHIREFARDNHIYSYKTFDINESIHNTLSILLVQFDELRIDLTLDLDDKLDLFFGDTYKLEQVLMNLLLNAKDALEERESISTVKSPKVIKIRSYQEGKMIHIEVTDNGIGIRAADMEKIMEPFFTTKETGKGVGMGLSISYGIISEMGGRIEVESKYMTGTTFRISLPVVEITGMS